MNYRILGRTNLKISEIGLGCEGFSAENYEMTEKLLLEAENNGVNYFDLYSPDPDVRKAVGRAIKGKRDKFIIQAHLGTVWEDKQYQRTRNQKKIEKSFNDLLEQLQTDYIDVGMIHYVDTEDDLKRIFSGPFIDYALKLKDEGKIHFLGLSSHNPTVALQAVKTGLIDVLMFSINPIYDIQPANDDVYYLFEKDNYQEQFINVDLDRQNLYEYCQNNGIGITVMKAFAGGKLLDKKLSQLDLELSVNQALNYCLTRPGVTSVMVGSQSVKEFQDCLKYFDSSEEEKDFSVALKDIPNVLYKEQCMYCGHCAPCPKHINVAMISKLLDLVTDEVPETVRDHYKNLESHASDCIECGVCETRCPFNVEIINNMKKAVEVFGY